MSQPASSSSEPATRAPYSRSGSAFARVRFQTVRSSPAGPIRAAIAAPIRPVPTQPTEYAVMLGG
jgi:hypothetical protein